MNKTIDNIYHTQNIQAFIKKINMHLVNNVKYIMLGSSKSLMDMIKKILKSRGAALHYPMITLTLHQDLKELHIYVRHREELWQLVKERSS